MMLVDTTIHVPALGAFSSHSDRVGIATRRNRYPYPLAVPSRRDFSPNRSRAPSPRRQQQNRMASLRVGSPLTSPVNIFPVKTLVGRGDFGSSAGSSSSALYKQRQLQIHNHRNTLGSNIPASIRGMEEREEREREADREDPVGAVRRRRDAQRMTFAGLHVNDEDNADLRRLHIMRSNQRDAFANFYKPALLSTSQGGIGGVWGNPDNFTHPSLISKL